MLFSTMDDRVQGDLLTIGLPQTVFDIAVVISGQRDFLVPNDLLFDSQFFEDILFDFRRDASGRRGPVVLDGEVQRIFSILVQEHEKSLSADLEDLLNVFSF